VSRGQVGFARRSQVENESKRLINTQHLVAVGNTPSIDESPRRDRADLVTSGVAQMVKSDGTSCDLHVAAESVRLRSKWDDGDDLARAVVQNIHRHDDGRLDERRLVRRGSRRSMPAQRQQRRRTWTRTANRDRGRPKRQSGRETCRGCSRAASDLVTLDLDPEAFVSVIRDLVHASTLPVSPKLFSHTRAAGYRSAQPVDPVRLLGWGIGQEALERQDQVSGVAAPGTLKAPR